VLLKKNQIPKAQTKVWTWNRSFRVSLFEFTRH